jgi:hypothetical protein
VSSQSKPVTTGVEGPSILQTSSAVHGSAKLASVKVPLLIAEVILLTFAS